MSFDFEVDGAQTDTTEQRHLVGTHHLRWLAAGRAPGKRVLAVIFYRQDPVGFDDDFGFASGLHLAFNPVCLTLWLWLK